MILVSLATLGALVIWFQGKIFEPYLMMAQAYRDKNYWLGGLLSCPLCLSVHITFWLELLCQLPVDISTSLIWWHPVVTFIPRVLASSIIGWCLYASLFPED